MTTRHSTDVRRKQIADAALEIIAQDGLGAFTTLALAQRVGIAEGTIFRHFRTKRDVILAAIGRLEQRLFESTPPRTAEPIADLRMFFQRRMRVMGASPGMARLFFSEELARAAGEEGQEQVRRMQRRSLEHMRSCLEEAHRRGMTREGASPDLLLVIVHGAALALIHAAMLGENTGPLPERADKAWQGIETLIRR